MYRHLLSVSVIASILCACVPGPSIPMPIPAKARSAEKTAERKLRDQIHDKLMEGTDEQFHTDREKLRSLRLNAQSDPAKWPICSGLEEAYVSHINQTKTLIGIQEALLAAKIDDHVLCDIPTLGPKVEAQAKIALKKFSLGMKEEDAFKILMTPERAAMDPCFLNTLREARQYDQPYNEAYAAVSKKCHAAAQTQSPGKKP